MSLLVLLAVLGAACGTARAETQDFTSDLGTAVATRPTLAAVAISESSPVAGIDPAVLALPEGIHVDPSLAVDRPDGFPTMIELGPLVAAGVQHPRARIESRLALTSGVEAFEAAGYNTESLDQRMTITYFDGVVVWEDPDGFTQMFAPDIGSYYLDPDGNWQVATGSEWTVYGPLSDWSLAQEEASVILSASNAQMVGYETVAGTPTMRLLLVQGDDRAHVWIDETGATLRLIEDFGGPDGSSRWAGVWSVETLTPEVAEPVPGS